LFVNKFFSDIEDPIEFVFKQNKCIISQREIGHDSRSFKNALKGLMRQDPDIVFVVDRSGSMGGTIDIVRANINEFVDSIKERDEVLVGKLEKSEGNNISKSKDYTVYYNIFILASVSDLSSVRLLF